MAIGKLRKKPGEIGDDDMVERLSTTASPGSGRWTARSSRSTKATFSEAPHRPADVLALGDVRITLPCRPSKFLALWNNDHAQAAKQGLAIPPEPLYFIKAASSYCAHGQTIEVPASYDGRVVYEGELGVVIGRVCKNLSVEDAAEAIFGVTCVNDVTAIERAATTPFAQWTRAKSCDTFGVIGPVIATGLDLTPAGADARQRPERQNFP